MNYWPQMQGSLLRARKRRIARQILQSLTPFSAGLSVSQGDYVSSENVTSAWQAQNSGTSGATAPTGTGLQSDGTIQWLRVDMQSLLAYQYQQPPTP